MGEITSEQLEHMAQQRTYMGIRDPREIALQFALDHSSRDASKDSIIEKAQAYLAFLEGKTK